MKDFSEGQTRSNDHSLMNPQSVHLNYLWVDECRWLKIDQTILSAKYHCTRTVIASAGNVWVNVGWQDPLVVVEPHRPPMSNEGTETAFRHNHCKHFQKRKHHSGSEVSWCDHRPAQTPKEAFLGQSSRRNYTGGFRSWPPATCTFSTRRSLVKETIILYKRVSKKWKKVKLGRISHWSDNDENATDCEIACDCVKRANVVVGLWKEIFARTHRYPEADICSAPFNDHDDTHLIIVCGAPRPTNWWAIIMNVGW